MPVKTKYPLNIPNDPDVDILKAVPELRIYPEIKKMVKKDGLKKANKILRCYFLLLDPRSWVAERDTEEGKMLWIRKNYYEIDWKEYAFMVQWYEKNVLINYKIITFVQEKRVIETREYTKTIDKLKDLEALEDFGEKAYGVIEQFEEDQIQGNNQVGLLANMAFKRKINE